MTIKQKFKYNDIQMVEEAMTRIKTCQQHQEAFEAIKYHLNSDSYRQSGMDCGNLHEKLYKKELDEWRGLFMWGLVVDDSTRDRIKVAAYERFLSDGMHVADWMNNGEAAGSWLTSDEEEFREMCKRVFSPIGG